jgi:hypothetical protein
MLNTKRYRKRPVEVPEEAKRCPKCGETKSVGEFYRDSREKDGLQSRCKPCKKVENRDWRRANPERVKATDKRWKKENAEQLERHVKRYRQRFPEKVRARHKVRNAVRDGRLTKPDRCEDCGRSSSTRELHAHHDDYSKPMEVRWLCPSCHGKEHRSLDSLEGSDA